MADSHLLGEEHPNYDEIYGNNPDSNHFSSWLPRQPRQAPFFLQWLPWIIHLLLFSINGSLLTLAWQYRDAAKSHSLQAGSFYEGNQFGTVVQQIGESTDFQGRPSGVNDKYWNSLLYSTCYCDPHPHPWQK
jgi:hypothetical protein